MDNEQAFPVSCDLGSCEFVHDHGLTKREWFAGLALAGILNFKGIPDNDAVRDAVLLSDLLIKKLSKEKTNDG